MRCPTARAMMSFGPPGGNGTISLIGFAGNSCAVASAGKSRVTAKARRSRFRIVRLPTRRECRRGGTTPFPGRRAARSEAEWCAADPESYKTPSLCDPGPAVHRFALHRIRDTRRLRARRHGVLFIAHVLEPLHGL